MSIIKTEDTKTKIRISVRNLIGFILRSGDIDNRNRSMVENAMAEGSRLHRKIQKSMSTNYQSEVMLRTLVEGESYDVEVEGRADGIITNYLDNSIMIDEIKCTYSDFSHWKEANTLHLAQGKCYGAIYLLENKMENINIRITYCNIESEELKYFQQEYSKIELIEWFIKLVNEYRKWADLEYRWKKLRQESIKNLLFPFPYRKGQKELVTYTYQTVYHKKKLFIEAPTGVGKTISTVFPAIKAMGEDFGDKLFYFTAKTITRTVASDTFQLLRNNGLKFKTVELTAKDKICLIEEVECNPIACPYAKGHFDRVNTAIYDLLQKEENYPREVILKYALKHQVCPFEFCLDISEFSDGIICDYNYLFDPHVYLKRYFGEGNTNEYLFLIDEAHNLVDRGREMYSATLCKEDFLRIKNVVKDHDSIMARQLEKCNKEMLYLKRECENYEIVDSISIFILACSRLFSTMEKYLQKNNDTSIRKEILDFYFEIRHFLAIYDGVDDNYITYTQLLDTGKFLLKLFCINPSDNLKECMNKGRSTILFSATLLPIQYFKMLLGGDEKDFEVYAESVFHSSKRALLIAKDVTSKYTNRNETEYYNIACYIHKITKSKRGNYMIFFPSHSFLKKIFQVYQDNFMNEDIEECLTQSGFMDEGERELFLEKFTRANQCDFNQVIKMEVEEVVQKSLLGFCVLGGIFSEGIDLKDDSLIGAIVVGTGLPQVCTERELIKEYFDELGYNGFEYSYQYPGMNKVLQAAGRVIRTVTDQGIIVLLDKRFLSTPYQKLFPREWDQYQIITKDEIGNTINEFWQLSGQVNES